MRVVVATAFPADPDAPRGGVEAVSVTLIRALANAKALDVHVVTVRPQELPVVTSSWNGATLHVLARRGTRMLTSAMGPDRRNVLAYVSHLSPDLVHAHDTYGLMLKGLQVPRVLTIHGFIHEDTRVSKTRFSRVRAAAWRRVEHATWADYPHIIAISPYVRERLSGIATGTIHDVDNPVDPRCFQVERHDVRPPVIFSAAVISRRKNALGLVEAMSRLTAGGSPVRLRLAGAIAEPAYHQRLVKYITACGLEHRVELLGSVDTSRVRGELSRAAVFALVSREENSPLGIQEAMAAGVPIVTSNRCGMPYLIRDGETGFLVDPEDPDDVAHSLEQVISNTGLAAAMGAKAREVAIDRFHPDAVARRTCAVYDRALRQGRRFSG